MNVYTIVAADSSELLAERVNGYLSQGGSVVGGVSVFTQPNKLPVLLQAMLIAIDAQPDAARGKNG